MPRQAGTRVATTTPPRYDRQCAEEGRRVCRADAEERVAQEPRHGERSSDAYAGADGAEPQTAANESPDH